MNAKPSVLKTPWFGRFVKTQEYLFLQLWFLEYYLRIGRPARRRSNISNPACTALCVTTYHTTLYGNGVPALAEITEGRSGKWENNDVGKQRNKECEEKICSDYVKEINIWTNDFHIEHRTPSVLLILNSITISKHSILNTHTKITDRKHYKAWISWILAQYASQCKGILSE